MRKIKGFTPPKEECKDRNCPWHGNLAVRGRTIKGRIVKFKADKTAVLLIERIRYVKKYLRYEKRETKVSVHVPPCIPLKEGDNVVVAECRPISKTKSFVVLQKI